MFDVTTDSRLRLLHIVMQGFWDTDTMAAYSADVRQKMAVLLRTGGCTRILINMIGFQIQTQEIAEAHAQNLRIVKGRGGTHVALVMQSALSKLQAARVASDTGHTTFNTEEAAMAWLLADES